MTAMNHGTRVVDTSCSSSMTFATRSSRRLMTWSELNARLLEVALGAGMHVFGIDEALVDELLHGLDTYFFSGRMRRGELFRALHECLRDFVGVLLGQVAIRDEGRVHSKEPSGFRLAGVGVRRDISELVLRVLLRPLLFHSFRNRQEVEIFG